MKEIGVMVEPEVRLKISKNFKTRVVSAICILPIPILTILMGSWVFAAFMAFLGVFLVWEWNRLIGLDAVKGIGCCAPILVGLSIGLFWMGNYQLTLLCLVGASVYNVALGSKYSCNKLFIFWGAIYIFLPCACLLWIREYPGVGLELTLWLLIVVCTTDMAAYFLGKMIGGPKLAPKISPGKTWAGLIGGIICSSFLGILFGSYYLEFIAIPQISKWGGLVILMAVAAQVGDLAESWLKRRMGVKDSGTIIPGHGGLLDRLDGFMLSAPVLTVAIMLIESN